ncbi:MAG: hypothetical protein H8E41_13935 [Desulfobulbaceae bacterium]|uniref:Uncharacterized protein n=1 Tax=Candidatus Desulfobia pelagia TaxID=2841692 RepID=A0A8J6NID4_9BACT|nr:hypothetical protein [Candidatus Desulfobia pelagia]
MSMRSVTGIKEAHKAAQKRQDAQAAEEKGDMRQASLDLKEAKRLQDEADIYLESEQRAEIAVGNEALPQQTTGIEGHQAFCLRATLNNPSQINLDASQRRMELADNANVLPLALDMAETVDAENSIEKAICHQMAMLHDMSMKVAKEAMEEHDTVEKGRLINATTKLINTFQQGVAVLQKLKMNGQQTMVVQHQHINIDNQNGQTLVTGNVEGGQDGHKRKK